MARELRMSTTFSLNVSPNSVTRSACKPARKRQRRHSRAIRTPRVVVDAPTRENHVGVVPSFWGPMGKVIRIDPYAVPADQARHEIEEGPFRAGRCHHI